MAKDSKAVTVNDVQLVAVTLWRTDFAPETWTKIIESPVRASRDLLAKEGYTDMFGKAWGRAFRTKGAAVDASVADSVQYHTEIKKGPRLTALLRRSGFNAVYLIPKSQQGDLDPNYKVL